MRNRKASGLAVVGALTALILYMQLSSRIEDAQFTAEYAESTALNHSGRLDDLETKIGNLNSRNPYAW